MTSNHTKRTGGEMYVIEMVLLSPKRLTELRPESLRDAELAVENLVTLALLQVFGSLIVARVRIRDSAA